VTAEWLVALEATAEPDAFDVNALARRLGALGDCRPEADSDRYVVMLREHGEEPVDALRGAVTRFEEAAGALGRSRARLVGARLVSSKESVPPLPDPPSAPEEKPAPLHFGRPGPTGPLWSQRLRSATLAVVVLVVVFAGWRLLQSGDASRPSLTGRGRLAAVAPHNLLPAGSFDTPTGLPVDARAWGGARASAVRAVGNWVEQVQVLPGNSGGIYMEAPVEPGTLYTQSVLLQGLALDPGARIEMVLEWYDAGHNLVGYRMVPVTEPDRARQNRTQTVRAPSGTATARFLVNATGGATYQLAGADLVVAPADAKPTPG
jgi:hypothetical protein